LAAWVWPSAAAQAQFPPTRGPPCVAVRHGGETAGFSSTCIPTSNPDCPHYASHSNGACLARVVTVAVGQAPSIKSRTTPGGIDLEIRIAALPDSSLLVRKLCPVRRLVVGAPSYFERHGRPKLPEDLAGHACLSYSYLPTGDVWQFTNRKGEKQSVRIKGPLSANNGDALDDALKQGLGLALQPDFIAWQSLQDGALERVLTDWSAPPLAVNILTPAGGTRPSRVTALIEFLVRHFAADAVPWAALK
jgi:DNA-binding transcriptional LysR family regulator